MKTAFAAALLSLCLSAQAFYILVDAGPAAWLEGNRVEQVSVELSNGDPAIPGELARSRQPFDAANIKAVDGQIVAMAEAEVAARDAAEAQAAMDAAEEAALPQVFPTGIATLDDEGHHIELVPDMVDGVVVPVQISNSPITVKDREAMKAAAVAVRAQAKAEKAALKAEVKDAKNDKAKLVAILKWIEAQ